MERMQFTVLQISLAQLATYGVPTFPEQEEGMTQIPWASETVIKSHALIIIFVPTSPPYLWEIEHCIRWDAAVILPFGCDWKKAQP